MTRVLGMMPDLAAFTVVIVHVDDDAVAVAREPHVIRTRRDPDADASLDLQNRVQALSRGLDEWFGVGRSIDVAAFRRFVWFGGAAHSPHSLTTNVKAAAVMGMLLEKLPRWGLFHVKHYTADELMRAVTGSKSSSRYKLRSRVSSALGMSAIIDTEHVDAAAVALVAAMSLQSS